MRSTFFFKSSMVMAAVWLFSTTGALAHFGMIIPGDDMVSPAESRKIDPQISFSHPFEGVGMDMEKPAEVKAYYGDQIVDLLPELVQIKVMDHQAWKVPYTLKRPGAHVVVVEPKPYWEPSEDCFIVHYTKTVVAAFGDDAGWDREVGLKTEIIPLSRPFGLYAGNVFQGFVKRDGAPVSMAEVEVEYYNRDKTAEAPSDLMITQTIKADANGVFTYAVPAPGWWGFSALTTADTKLAHEGVEKSVELGAVLWVRFHEFGGNSK